jgi:hypothetical protein
MLNAVHAHKVRKTHKTHELRTLGKSVVRRLALRTPWVLARTPLRTLCLEVAGLLAEEAQTSVRNGACGLEVAGLLAAEAPAVVRGGTRAREVAGCPANRSDGLKARMVEPTYVCHI